MTHPEVFSTGKFSNDIIWSRWCNVVNPVDSVEEKSSAYLGFIKITAMSGNVQMSNTTLHKIIEGLSRNVDTSVFSQEIIDFLMIHQQKLSQVSFNDHELHFLQSFTS